MIIIITIMTINCLSITLRYILTIYLLLFANYFNYLSIYSFVYYFGVFNGLSITFAYHFNHYFELILSNVYPGLQLFRLLCLLSI